MSANQVLSLLDWVPDLSAVTGLRISTRDTCNPNTCKQIVKKLAAAKKNAGVSSMNLRTLILEGPKIYASVVNEAVKNKIGPTLSTLSFVRVKTTKQTKLGEGNCIPNLLMTCSRLEALHMPQALAVESNTLRAHLSALSLARSGAATLLRVLDLNRGESEWGADLLTLQDITKLGTCM